MNTKQKVNDYIPFGLSQIHPPNKIISSAKRMIICIALMGKQYIIKSIEYRATEIGTIYKPLRE